MQRVKIVFALILLFSGGFYLASQLGMLPAKIPVVFDPSAGKPMNQALLDARSEYDPLRYPVASGEDVSGSFGITRPLVYQGRVVGRPNNNHSIYCSGLLLDIYFRAAERTAGPNFRLEGVNSFRDFRRDWYGFDGNERTLVNALASRGLGTEVTDPLEAQPGDFIQFWRGRTGHSALFLGWELDENSTVTGIRYWSVQNSTDGISEHVEYLRGRGGSVDPSRIYLVRAHQPHRG